MNSTMMTLVRKTAMVIVLTAVLLTAYAVPAAPIENALEEQISNAPVQAEIDPYTKAGILFGFVYIGCYLLASALRHRSWPDLVPIVLLFVSGFGLAVGWKLIVVACETPELGPFHGEDRYYIIIGGIVVIWASIRHLAVEITRRPESLFR